LAERSIVNCYQTHNPPRATVIGAALDVPLKDGDLCQSRAVAESQEPQTDDQSFLSPPRLVLDNKTDKRTHKDRSGRGFALMIIFCLTVSGFYATIISGAGTRGCGILL
jgi:hypothetical protein